jgi:lipid II:glycine glycyltransferase (peptidoglycan interpeptide bridge formation enzyme)
VFEDIRELPTASRTLWIAERDGAIGAGVLTFSHHRHKAVWHSAADAAFFERGAMQLLYRDMVADALASGFAELDFLGSAGLPGVETFKTRFGARALEFDSSLNRTGLVGALASLRDRLRGKT